MDETKWDHQYIREQVEKTKGELVCIEDVIRRIVDLRSDVPWEQVEPEPGLYYSVTVEYPKRGMVIEEWEATEEGMNPEYVCDE